MTLRARELDDDYRFDEFDDGSTAKQVSDMTLDKFESFVRKYDVTLEDIEETLDERLGDVWDWITDPVKLWVDAHENTTLVDLVKTDNQLFDKVIRVLSFLTEEVYRLKEEAETKYYGPLAVFGLKSDPNNHDLTNPDAGSEFEEGEIQMLVGRVFNFLGDLMGFITRAFQVARNFVRQLASLYNAKETIFKSFKEVEFRVCFTALADLFTVLITLDELIAQNETLTNGWGQYKRMMKAAKLELGRYGVDEKKMRQFEKFVLLMEGELLYGLIFKNCIDQEFDYPNLLEVRTNKNFQHHVKQAIESVIADATERIVSKQDMNDKDSVVGAYALYAFYFNVFRDTDKKLFKTVWEAHRLVPVVHLIGDVAWFPTIFLRKVTPQMVKTIPTPNVNQYRLEYLKLLDESFNSRVQDLYLRVCTWMVRVESDLSPASDIRDILTTRLHLFTEGASLAYELQNLLKTSVLMHVNLEQALKSSHIKCISLIIQCLKGIQATYHRRNDVLAENIPYMVQQLCLNLQFTFAPIKKRLTAGKKFNDSKLDSLSAVTIALEMLNGTATSRRRTVLKMCMPVIKQLNVMNATEWSEIENQVRRLDLICELQTVLQKGCDTSFMYWHRELIPRFFKDIFAQPEREAQKLPHLLAALRDPLPLLNFAMHLENKDALLIQPYQEYVRKCLVQFILVPLCQDIETDLRLHIHSHLQVSDRNPFKGDGLRDKSKFLKLRPLRVFDNMIDVKDQVIHYLDTTFYNLTTVALHDWKTYEEMRNLAFEKFGLLLTDVYLPGNTLDQGLDVLEIMRNINVFAANYKYNLNEQIFVQHSTENKNLNTINIQHIANSIRTHGTGIMNTTVNFAFQYLKKMFMFFSQFLYDDHIKSPLLKDIRFFKENKDKLNSMYPFERAERFNRDIRKLGVTETGATYLDQFRVLITEIGNTLGYVRMIRNGGLHYCSDAIRFVPDLENIVKFEEAVKKDNLPQLTADAAKNLDEVVENLTASFSSGTDYLKKLVDVFAPLRNPNNTHLRNLYIMIPALTYNFCEHMLIEKEKLLKKGKEACFTDDGFAIGIAYIIKVLDQSTEFDSLHWFDSVRMHYENESKKYEGTANTGARRGKEKEEADATLRLTMKKLRSYELEFELLYYSFSGARIFFKETD